MPNTNNALNVSPELTPDLFLLRDSIVDEVSKQEKLNGDLKRFDPATLIIIIQIIVFIINLFKKKSSAVESIQKQARNLNLLERAFLKAKLTRYINDVNDEKGRASYKGVINQVLKPTINQIGIYDSGKMTLVVKETPVLKSSYLV